MSNKASHILIKKIVSQKKKSLKLSKKQCNLIVDLFRCSGGSWENVFKGGTSDILLLKKTIKNCIKLKIVE